jgi:DNA repair exonuclease SbcCD nuclease subunit
MSKIIEIGEYFRFKLIGDPHLGRVFKTGVPLHRLGEREQLVFEQFQEELLEGEDDVIIMGDLFDTYIVDPTTLLKVSDVINRVNHRVKGVYILRGNHDESRDSYTRGSFDVLERLCLNATFVKSIRSLYHPTENVQVLLCGYDAFTSSHDILIGLPKTEIKTLAALGHWDLTSHGSDFNLVPTEALAKLGVPVVYTGHIHKAQTIERHGVTVHAVGSLQPYAHGEQQVGDTFYQTLTLEEFGVRDPAEFKDVNLRIILKGNETFTEQLDCLSLTFKHIAEDETAPIEVAYDNFDADNILDECLQGVSAGLVTRVKNRLSELKMENV